MGYDPKACETPNYEVEELGATIQSLRAEVETLRREREELLAAGEKAVSEMKATAWDEEGYCLDPDLDESADELAAAIVKVKP